MNPIDRTFQAGDERLFAELTAGSAGHVCSSWRKSYGRTGSLHLGTMVVRESPPPKAVHKTQGTWIVDLWDCDRQLSLGGQTLDSRGSGDSAVLDRMPELEGRTVLRLTLDPKALSLRIDFSGDATLLLMTHSEASREDEQWALQLPDGRAVMGYGNRRWVVGW